MTGPSAIFDVLAALPLEVSPETAEAVALERWGLRVRARALSGERDRNFHLLGALGHEYVLKFANPAEDAGFRDMQISALRHIARADPGLSVPRIVPLPDGTVETRVPHGAGGMQHVRMLSWVSGQPIGSSRPSADQRLAYGAMVARLQGALAGFSHAASGHRIAWDLQHAPGLRDIAFAIPHAEARRVLHALLDEFDARVIPMLPSLRRQVVHNDLTRMNVLVDPVDHDRMTGVIDFGDIAETAAVFDVAIAAVSQPGPDMDTDAAVGHFVRGFHARWPLLAEEVALMPLLMACRIAMGLTLASWHRHMQPDNPHFDLSDAAIQRRLAIIAAFHAPSMARSLRHACGFAAN